MAEFNLMWATVITLLSAFIPGFLLAYPLLRKTTLRIFEIAAFGLVIGFFLPPTMLFFESLLGINFSFSLVLANLVALSAIGAFLTARGGLPKGNFSLSVNLDEVAGKIDLFGKGRKNLVWIALFLVLIFAYWIRITGVMANPYSQSPDPYSYLVTTRYIIIDGSVPLNDDLAWFPNVATHRERPLMQYMLASWYSVYTAGGSGFDRILLLQLAGIYPALFGAIGCLLIFILLSRFIGDWFGLFGAIQGTLLPITVIMVAWGPEQTPWAIFAMLAFFASYALQIKEGRWEYVILSAVAIVGVALGSKADLFAYSVFAVYAVFQGTMLFLAGKPGRKFVAQTIAVGGVAVVSFLLYYYFYKEEGLTPVLGLILLLVYVTALSALSRFVTPKFNRQNVLTALIGLVAIISLAYAFLAGATVSDYVNSMFSSSNLFSTIAEHQDMTGGEYVTALGVLGSGFQGLKILDVIIVLFFLLVTFDFAYRGERSALFLAIIVLPLYLFFSNNLKFVSYFGAMTALALAFCLGGVYALSAESSREAGKKKNEDGAGAFTAVGYAVMALAGLLVAYQAAVMVMDVSPFVFASPLDIGNMCLDQTIQNRPVSEKLFCNKIPAQWVSTLEWVQNNTDKDEAVLAWWDYGHWINFLGERKVVVRNDLAYQGDIQELASLLTMNRTAPTVEYMKFAQNGRTRAKYLLLDQELAGKWSAVSYLSCLKNGELAGAFSPYPDGRSECEKALDFEFFQDPSTISLSDYCSGERQTHFKVVTNKRDVYCMPTKIQNTAEVFDKDMKNPMNVTIYTMGVYGGSFVSKVYLLLYGKSEAGKFGGPYSSVFYSGWGLGELDGFDKLYTGGGQVPGYITIYEVK